MTPTVNRSLPLRLGGFETLADALDYAAQGETGLNFFDSRGNLATTISYCDLRAAALAVASRLHAHGIVAGDRVALVAETCPAFLAAFYGCQYAGITPCVLPNRVQVGGSESYVAQLARLFGRTRANWLFVPAPFLPLAEKAADAVGGQVEVLETLMHPDASFVPVRRANGPAYVQYSSGSTAEPKGIVVEQLALMANVTAIARDGLRLRADDRAFSWLPLYHDMGLVGFSIVAMAAQRSVDYLSPRVFAVRPGLWLRLMSRQRTSVVYAPSFAWRLAADRYPDEQGLDLSALRIAGIGGDLVRPDDMAAFARSFASVGFRETAFQPSYGLAEATLAVSISDADRLPWIDAADRAGGRRFASCGRPLPGVEIRIEREVGYPLPDGAVGRIRVRGPSIMRRYDADDAGAAEAIDGDGFLDTGDLGFVKSGELFVTGREKDLIAVRGRKIWAQDIERVAGDAVPSGLHAAAAFAGESEEDGERAVLILEAGADADEALRTRINEALAAALGITATILFVDARSLPHTTSGKLARARARERYLAGEWPEAGRTHNNQPIEVSAWTV